MSFKGTYSSASYRGWQALGGRGDYPNQIQIIPPYVGDYPSDVDMNTNGDYFVVGSRANAVAYVYYKSGSTWALQATLTASDAGSLAASTFGISVSINSTGDIIIIGDDTNGTTSLLNYGAVYVFTRSGTTWTQSQKLQATDKADGDLFGYACNINDAGNAIAIGAPSKAVGGAVYVFTGSIGTFSQQTKITNGSSLANWDFGNAVDIGGDPVLGLTNVYIVIGASAWRATGPAPTFTGAVFVYQPAGGGTLLDIGGTANDLLGWSVAINSTGDYIIAGARTGTLGSVQSGYVNIYKRTGAYPSATWALEVQTARQNSPTAGDGFGQSVSINGVGDVVAIGADLDTPLTNSGATFIFTRSGSTWAQAQQIQAGANVTFSQSFGSSVSISEDSTYVISTAPYYPGSVYINY